MLDYLLVGFGLAGASLAHQLENRNKRFLVFEDQSHHSSTVAGGLYNPLILKRFTLAWNAEEQLRVAIDFYKSLEEKLALSFQKEIPIHRKFHSIEEQNNWFQAADKPGLSSFLKTQLVSAHKNIPAQYQFGVVNQTGIVDLPKMLNSYSTYLRATKKIQHETFDYALLEIKEESISYKNHSAKGIIFCEGFGLKQNPFFNYLPMTGTKGEFISIKSPALQLKEVIKSSIFIIPQGKDIYKVGATYDWEDKSQHPTEKARQELVSKLKQLISCEFEIIDQNAGIRPTIIDRRPLVGRHPRYKNLYVCNGFGTRGVMVAPTVSQQLVEFMEEKKPLPHEIDILRFEK